MSKSTKIINFITENFRNNYLSNIVKCLEEIKLLLNIEYTKAIKNFTRFTLIPQGFRVNELVDYFNANLASQIYSILELHGFTSNISKIEFREDRNSGCAFYPTSKILVIGVSKNLNELDYRYILPRLAHEILHSLQFKKRPNFYKNIDKWSRYANNDRDPYQGEESDYRIAYHITVTERQAWYIDIILSASYSDVPTNEFSIIIEKILNGLSISEYASKYPYLIDNLRPLYKIMNNYYLFDKEKEIFTKFLNRLPLGYIKFSNHLRDLT
jgi:hypothetical protein